jgi:hypothetical protein
VPIAVAGPAPEVQSLRARLDRAQPGAFTVTVVADAARARALILDRTVYGAVVLGGTPQVLTAGAASPAISQLLASVGSGIGAVSMDVRPLPAADPKGAGLAAGAFPLVLACWFAAGIALFVFGEARAHRRDMSTVDTERDHRLPVSTVD